jgi:hypothetical protein
MNIEDINVLIESPEGLDHLRQRLRGSVSLRENGPLMIKPLCDKYESSPVEVEALLLEISVVCKYHETFTFSIESWVENKLNQHLHACLLNCMTNALVKATKGPLANKKTQYFVQLCSLILNGYFQAGGHYLEPLDDSLITSVIRLLSDTADDEVFIEEHSRNEMAQVCRRDMQAVLMLRVNRYMCLMGLNADASDFSREFSKWEAPQVNRRTLRRSYLLERQY